ncbi:MAG: molybdopterin oxidoreductase family protein, partial [Desulfobacterales bacterium]
AIDGKAVTREKALDVVRGRLERIVRESGSAAIACAGSLRSSLETLAAIDRLSRQNGWHEPSFWMDRCVATRVKTAASRLEADTAVSLRQIEEADVILVVGADPINEAPMLAMAMRQAWRRGARVIVIDPRPVFLPFDVDHLPAAPEEMARGLGMLIKRVIERGDVEPLGHRALSFYDSIPEAPLPVNDRLEAAAGILKASHRPIVICGTEVVPDNAPALAADMVLLLKAKNRSAGLFYVFPGANAFGATLPPGGQAAFEDILVAVENKTVRALVLVECDPLRGFADRPRLEKALASLDMLVVMDYLGTETVKRADIFLPTTTVFESGGLFVNQEGRLQAAPRAFKGGLSIKVTGDGRHPPRVYGSGMPGADPVPAHLQLAAMAGSQGPVKDDAAWREGLVDYLRLSDFLPAGDDLPEDGVRVLAAAATTERFGLDWAATLNDDRASDDRLRLVTVDWTFGTEELSGYSACLDAIVPSPVLFMHGKDAQRLGLADGKPVVLTTDTGSVTVALRVADNMRAGMVILPRHHRLDWQLLGGGPIWIAADRIQKADHT